MDSNIRPEELPDGFTTVDPTKNPSSSGNGKEVTESQRKEEQRRAILEQALAPEALARLGTLKLVKPDKAKAVEGLIANMAMTGKLGGRISEGKLIEMLEGIGAKQSQSNISINIQRKKYAFDSDEEDDDDDDLL